MSEAILIYQVSIFFIILVASYFSKGAMIVVTGLWVLETLIFVWSFSPLMFLQFGTITISYFLADKFSLEHYREKRIKGKMIAQEEERQRIERGEWKDETVGSLAIFLVCGLVIGYMLLQDSNKTSESANSMLNSPKERCLNNNNLGEWNPEDSKWECTNLYRLTIQATPATSKIQIMNIKPKYFHGIKLKKGRYDIRVSKKGYKTERFYIEFEGHSTYEPHLEKLENTKKNLNDNIYSLQYVYLMNLRVQKFNL